MTIEIRGTKIAVNVNGDNAWSDIRDLLETNDPSSYRLWGRIRSGG